MTTSKELFCSDAKLKEWWSSVVANPMFDSVMLHARGVALEQEPSSEQRAGAIHFSQILATLHQPAVTGDHFPRPGLKHELPERGAKEPTKKKTP